MGESAIVVPWGNVLSVGLYAAHLLVSASTREAPSFAAIVVSVLLSHALVIYCHADLRGASSVRSGLGDLLPCGWLPGVCTRMLALDGGVWGCAGG